MRVGEKREKDIDAEGMLTEQKHEERAFRETKRKTEEAIERHELFCVNKVQKKKI